MLLEKLVPECYFGRLGLQTPTPEEIVACQSGAVHDFEKEATRQGLIEEFLEATVPARIVPFDYKFYCSNSGSPGTVELPAFSAETERRGKHVPLGEALRALLAGLCDRIRQVPVEQIRMPYRPTEGAPS